MKKVLLFLIPVILTIIIIIEFINLVILPDTGKGAIQVTSLPFSKVYLNNKFIGNTPLCKCESGNMIPSGQYTIRLVPLQGTTAEFQEKITITKGVLTVVDRKFGKGAASEGSIITLLPLPDKKSSELLIISFPDKAEVSVDSNNQGNTPRQINNITDSDHTLRLKKEGYKEKSIRIRTPAGYKLVAVIYMGIKDENSAFTPTVQPSLSQQPSLSIKPSLSPTPKLKGTVTILQTPNGFLRVRQTASLDAAEIARVTPGDTYNLLDESNGWYEIKLQDGTLGWISSQFAQKK